MTKQKGSNTQCYGARQYLFKHWEEMCSDMEMIRLYEHFVLRGSVLLSEYWREACMEHKTQKKGNTWSDGSFAIIMKDFKN